MLLFLLLGKKEMIQHLFFDANVTQGMVEYWSGMITADLANAPQAAFVATESGLLRIYPAR